MFLKNIKIKKTPLPAPYRLRCTAAAMANPSAASSALPSPYIAAITPLMLPPLPPSPTSGENASSPATAPVRCPWCPALVLLHL